MAFSQSFPRTEISSDKLRQQYEGLLYKYTNVVKGWQYRWFILDPETGVLNYFVSDSERKQRPRGSVHLAGAVISPSDEDSNTFTVNSATSDMFKLRASDARARQEWVNRLRAVAEMHTMAIAQVCFSRRRKSTSNPPLPPREHHSIPMVQSAPASSSSAGPGPQPSPRVHCSLAVLDAFSTVRENLHRAEQSNYALARNIEELPSSGSFVRSIDSDLLVLKATSQATLLCLGQCLFILQQQQVTLHRSSAASSQTHLAAHLPLIKKNSLPTGMCAPTQCDEINKKGLQHEFSSSAWSEPSPTPPPLTPVDSKGDSSPARLSLHEEVTDEDDEPDAASEPAEEHRSVILHLLSQLKLGMDLTRVVLPTFILERRSLLEMFADCMGHPDCFVNIGDADSPRTRMLAVLEWYLTSFHMGRKSSVAKKPYNPIMGETFHCSWRIPVKGTDDSIRLWYSAEQVSHHPPVTAFYVECPEKQICLNASIWTRSNFSGMSVGVNMVGDISLYLGNHRERYDFGLPAAYARSILSIPWVELGGKVTLVCPSTGYSSNIVFHTKPFYGGKVNQVTAEVKHDSGAIICRVAGEWNSHYEFTYPNGDTSLVEVDKLTVYRKRVRHMGKQHIFESRRLWCQVTRALKSNDIATATSYKRALEERQRIEERLRREEGIPFVPAYFTKVDDNWVFKKLSVKF